MSESYYDRRLREKAEAAATEKRKQERAVHYKAQQLPEIWKAQAANSAAQAENSAAWCAWVDRRIYAKIAGWWGIDVQGEIPLEGAYRAIGDMFAEQIRDRRKETKAATEEVKREFKTMLEALELRIDKRTDRPIIGRDGKDADPEIVARLVGDRIETPLREFIRAQIDTQFTALERRIVEHVDRRVNEHIAQATERTCDRLAQERRERQTEMKNAADTAQNDFKAELNANFAVLEQRVVQHTDQRVTQHTEQCTERTHALGDVIATERWDRQKEIKAVEEAQKRGRNEAGGEA